MSCWQGFKGHIARSCGALGHWKAECLKCEQTRETANLVCDEGDIHDDLLQVHFEVSDEDSDKSLESCFVVQSVKPCLPPAESLISSSVRRQATRLSQHKANSHMNKMKNNGDKNINGEENFMESKRPAAIRMKTRTMSTMCLPTPPLSGRVRSRWRGYFRRCCNVMTLTQRTKFTRRHAQPVSTKGWLSLTQAQAVA